MTDKAVTDKEANRRQTSPEDAPLSSLNQQKIEAAIAQSSTELGVCPEFAHIKPQVNIHTYASLPSTNTQLWKLLAAGAPSGTVVIAQQQSAGKGQRTRHWESPPGGLYLSLALLPNWPVSLSAQLTCISAWGLATAFNNLGIAVEIKWPNDLFFQGKKLGGILTETKLSYPNRSSHKAVGVKAMSAKAVDVKAVDVEAAPSADRQLSSPSSNATIKQAVIGVGINWHNPIPESGISLATILEMANTTQLAKNKINCLEVLIALTIRGILQGVVFHQQVGSQVFMKSYQKLLTQVGQTVSLDSNGNLSLATPWNQSLTPMATKALAQKIALRDKRGAKQVTSPATSPAISVTANQWAAQWANRSGEVVGVSEEGYLQVALHSPSRDKGDYSKIDLATVSDENILLLRPSEIHVS